MGYGFSGAAGRIRTADLILTNSFLFDFFCCSLLYLIGAIFCISMGCKFCLLYLAVSYCVLKYTVF